MSAKAVKDQDFGIMKICPVCGKEFYRASDKWVYKKYYGSHAAYFCTWTCFRNAPERLGAKARQPRQKKWMEPVFALDYDLILRTMALSDMTYGELGKRIGMTYSKTYSMISVSRECTLAAAKAIAAALKLPLNDVIPEIEELQK